MCLIALLLVRGRGAKQNGRDFNEGVRGYEKKDVEVLTPPKTLFLVYLSLNMFLRNRSY